jgi:hypothetical protein
MEFMENTDGKVIENAASGNASVNIPTSINNKRDRKSSHQF